jgi:two-component system CheB/CheR fusion protein
MNDKLIVGLGACAGGIQALKEFFAHTPDDSGMAYVVILHLAPDQDSHLAEVLQSVTKMPVIQVSEKQKVEANHVYVIPPAQHLTMEDGSIAVSRNITIEERRAPVDIFFRSLAESHGPHAVCVVLSGTGANGSMGLKRVKENGGAAFVQNPREAEFNEMPRNAIATDLVDDILNVAEIPARILAYKQSLGTVQIPVDSQNRDETDQQALREVFAQLRLRTGHDFTNYKRPTLLRRIERRMNVRGVNDLPSYAAYIAQHPEETQALLKDLLISVTNFFRDKRAFEELEAVVIPQLFEGKKQDSTVRIWVAGCATGEEAYSIAMLCTEYLERITDVPKVQVFATDIDEPAISHAREGYYTLNDAADLTPERLRRFFNKEGDGFRIRPEIREMVLFANHNFLKDPPFSRLELVTCRNVMIYLNGAAQERVLETFHFALNPGGFLFLGSAESVDGSGDLYSVLNREQHIYQSRQVRSRNFVVPESAPAFRVEHIPVAHQAAVEPRRNTERISFGELHQRLLEEYAPPSLVVNEEYDIVHMSDHVGSYLQVAGGEPSQNLLKLIREELRLELRSALYQATQQGRAVEVPGLKLLTGEGLEELTIRVRPVRGVRDPARGFILVVFDRANAVVPGDAPVIRATDDPIARHLEEELIRLKAQLRASNEHHEFQAEELKASNEELQAMNEEMRSATEELETSKEELQSINEELTTVNQELKMKVEEASTTSNNLQNLINSTAIGTVFLDRSFRVMLFTPAAREVFNLIPADYGRRLSDITNRLGSSLNLIEDAETVLEKLVIVEREIDLADDRVFLVRLSPYRTDEDRIQGVVITFLNITERKRSEDDLRKAHERLQVTMESATDYAIITMDAEGVIEGWSKGAERIFGYTASEAVGQTTHMIFTPEDIVTKEPEKELGTAVEQGFAKDERWHIRKDGSRFFMSGVVRPIRNGGFHTGFVKVARDMTEQKQSDEALRISEERYRIALHSAEMGAWDWDVETDRVVWNEQHYTMLGLLPNDKPVESAYFLQFVHAEDRESITRKLLEAVDTGGVYNAQFRIIRADNEEVRWMAGYGRTIDAEDGKATRMVGVMYDITRQKELEQQKDEFIAIASHELRTPVTSIKAYVEILQEMFEEAGDEERAALMQKLDSQVDRLTSLIHDLLDTTKVVEGRLKLVPENFLMDELITQTSELMQRTTVSHVITLELNAPVPVSADRERITQVLINLISNAIKYSSEGKIIVRSSTIGEEVTVSVEDSGVGMSEKVRARVFERFFRSSDPEIATYPGLGLGLYICAEIVRQHGGYIWAESEKGKGSVFSFTIPRVPFSA